MKTLITTLALLMAVPVFASVPKMSDSVRSSLDLPMGQRLSSLRKQGPDGYLALTKIMFDENETMNNRWKAVTAAARIGGVDAKPEIERALKSQTWYMRNAGLVAMRA